MSSNDAEFRMVAIRVAVDAALAAGLIAAPWAVVFASACAAIAVFGWYFEALAVGFAAGVLMGLPAWKLVFAFGLAIVAGEALKLRFLPRRWFSHIPIAAVVAGVFVVVFWSIV